MEGVIAACIVVGMFAIIVTSIFAAVRSSQTTDCYARLAQHYVGTSEPGGMFQRPKVRFVHLGAPVYVDVRSSGGKHPTHFTRIQISLPQDMREVVRCEIYPERMWARFGKLFGMADVEIGAEKFDDTFVIKAFDSPELRRLLNPAVQDVIERLRRFLQSDDIYVSFDSRRLLIEKRSFIRDYEPLLRYPGMAIQLFDLSVGPSDEGIEFVDDDPSQQWVEAMCQICGEEIKDDVVFCRRCKTPHHLDCWQYYGACSTYGCQEKKFMRPDSRRARREQRRL